MFQTHFSDLILTFHFFQVPLLVVMGIFFLGASSQLFNKLMIIAFYNMIKMGVVIQGELTWSVLKISGVINCFFLLENLHFCLVPVHVYDTRC